MKISSITSIPKKALNGVNELGGHAIKFTKETADTFCKSKPIQGIKKHTGITKETVAGSALVLLAFGSAATLIAGIKHKVDESKKILRDE